MTVVDAPLQIALVLALLVVLGWYLSWAASRLDRLHARVEGARHALDAQLQRRASAAQQLATSGVLDPATSVLLAQAAHDAREALPGEQEMRESELTAALRAALGDPATRSEVAHDPGATELLDELASACHRVELSRRLHNDAVRSAIVLRTNRAVRLLRLAGRAPLPASFEIDDATPAGLAV